MASPMMTPWHPPCSLQVVVVVNGGLSLGEEPCHEDELALLPPPDYGPVQRILFGKPYPILEDWLDQWLCSE